MKTTILTPLFFFIFSSLLSTSVNANCTLDTNIITSSTFENTSDLDNWAHTSGSGHIVRANYDTGWAGSAPNDAGTYFLYATGGNTIVEQNIDISTCTNTGNITYDFSTYLGGYGDGDTVSLSLDFKDINNNILATYNSSDFTSNRVMTLFQNTASLPNTVTQVTIRLSFKRNSGSDVDGYVDNLALHIHSVDDGIDTTAPVITLTGDDVNINIGQTYIDAGATANDNIDGDISSNIEINNTVDTSTTGTYTITYNVMDTAGNTASEVSRTVTVHELPSVDNCTLDTNIINSNSFENTNDINNWIKTSGSGHIVRANYATGWAGATPNDTGTYFLYATNGDTVVQQTINISSCTNTGNITYDFSAYHGGYGDGDTIAVNLDFKDINNNILSTYHSSDFTSNRVMTAFQHTAALTSTMTQVTISLIFKRHSGTDVDGYIDNLALHIHSINNDEDIISPTIILNGGDVSLNVGDSYIDAGATASDNIDGDITSNIETNNTVNINTIGTYTVTYNVIDAAGNKASPVSRTVTVQKVASGTLSFTDTFNNNTINTYDVINTWTSGGVGSLNYNQSNQNLQVITGNDVALTYSHDIPSSTKGNFSIDFSPIRHHPSGGIITLKLIQDANNYYKIQNTDGYGPLKLSKFINGIEIDTQPFNTEFVQGQTYTISIDFTPSSTTVEAFGDTITINNDSSIINVSSFSIDTLQQDAYYDNIKYTLSSTFNILVPQSNHIQKQTTLIAKASVPDLQPNWGVTFILDINTSNAQTIRDNSEPYEVIFYNLDFSEHTLDAYVHNELNITQIGAENHDSKINIGIGDIYIAIGDSITYGGLDDISGDDNSLDGRNHGGGYTPILNNLLTQSKSYPHSIINEGLNSETTLEGLIRLPSILSKYPNASTYLVLYGTNDSPTWAPLPSGKNLNIGDTGYVGTYKDYLQQIIQLINNAGKEVILAKVPVVLGFSSQTGRYSEPIDTKFRNIKTIEFNEVIDELIAIPSNNISIVAPDFYNYFRNNYLNEYSDNLHPNGLGYDSMANLWMDVLTP